MYKLATTKLPQATRHPLPSPSHGHPECDHSPCRLSARSITKVRQQPHYVSPSAHHAHQEDPALPSSTQSQANDYAQGQKRNELQNESDDRPLDEVQQANK